jgi:NAD(P)-dependent dehydrogenase (short-subunit alcohol dehydrogenase family)
MPIDASSQQSVREFARRVSERYSRLDVLINNAGINRSKRQTCVDGVELTFATNGASTYASALDLTDLQFERRAYEGRKAYAQSNACDRMTDARGEEAI